MWFYCYFFFFKQKTAYEMRISDWSSDVCSSDLQDKGLKLPKRLQAAFSRHVQQLADEAGRELNADDIWQLFKRTYLPGHKDRFVLVDYEDSGPTGKSTLVGRIAIDGEDHSVSRRGHGLIAHAFVGLPQPCGVAPDSATYNETPT